jgi:pimeloyl-ACP methyl ester carboxylesterase
MPRAIPLVISALLPLAAPGADRDEVAQVATPAEVKPGKTALVGGAEGMSYFLRVPRGYDAREGARLVVFLHGSDMNGLAYLRSFEEARWCRDDLIACPNGEQGGDPFGSNNFTFGSGPLVAGVTREVAAAFKATRVYLGGHSQGGFVAYSALMHFPDLYHGAFPMACDCWLQNEPNLWEDRPEVLAKQRGIAIAHIHGRADPVVAFSQGEHAYGVFVAMAYPKLRLFAPEDLGHQFLLSPVPEALEWLDAVTGVDPAESVRAAKGWARDGEWGWVHQAALAVLQGAEADLGATAEARRAVDAVEREAAEAAPAMAEAMGAESAGDWVPKWFEFRRQFGATEAARELVAEYEAARASEREKGAAHFNTALGHRRNGRSAEADQALRDILADAPHSFHAYYAWKWLGGG